MNVVIYFKNGNTAYFKDVKDLLKITNKIKKQHR